MGMVTVDTEINFNGLGLRTGIDVHAQFLGGLGVYGETFANLLAGSFEADYLQEFNLAGIEAQSSLHERRVVTQLELEVGFEWSDPCGRIRLRAGYYFGTWLNIATTPTWIDAVQANNTTDVSESLSFDGLVAQLEYRF